MKPRKTSPYTEPQVVAEMWKLIHPPASPEIGEIVQLIFTEARERPVTERWIRAVLEKRYPRTPPTGIDDLLRAVLKAILIYERFDESLPRNKYAARREALRRMGNANDMEARRLGTHHSDVMPPPRPRVDLDSKSWVSPEEFALLVEDSGLSDDEVKALFLPRILEAAKTDPDAARWLTERNFFRDLPLEQRERIQRVADLRRN